MKTEIWNIDRLVPYARNPRKNDGAVDKVAASLKEFGFRQPIVVDTEGVIIAGHTRYKAAKKLGMAEVPVHIATELTPAQVKAYRIADNKVGELAEWDDELLALEIDDLKLEDYDIELTGFDVDELPGGGADTEVDAEPQIDKAEELRAKWGVEPGQLWELGDHRLLCGDSTNKEDVERVMGGEKIAAVVTDPPYGMVFQSNHRKLQHKAIEGDGNSSLLRHAVTLDATHSVYAWCRWDNLADIPKPKSLITWVKNNWSMGDLDHEHARQTEVCAFYPGKSHRWINGRPTDVVKHDRTGNNLHPTQKPVSLIAEVIEWTEGLVYEPFSGSGTTIIACEQLGRKCRAIEISPAYVAVALQRWADATGKTPRLVE